MGCHRKGMVCSHAHKSLNLPLALVIRNEMKEMPLKPGWMRGVPVFFLAVLMLILLSGVFLSKARIDIAWTDLLAAIRTNHSSGPWICVALCSLFTLLFIPCTPLLLMIGAAYGAVAGTVYASIGTLIGATLAFLVARYALNRPIRRWIGDSKTFHWIDDGIKKDPWRIIIISRMFPVTPYNFLNYAYGLTGVPLAKYMIASWLGMLPPIIAWVWTAAAAGRIAEGNADKKIFVALLVGTAFFALTGYLPRLVRKRFSPPA